MTANQPREATICESCGISFSIDPEGDGWRVIKEVGPARVYLDIFPTPDAAMDWAATIHDDYIRGYRFLSKFQTCVRAVEE